MCWLLLAEEGGQLRLSHLTLLRCRLAWVFRFGSKPQALVMSGASTEFRSMQQIEALRAGGVGGLLRNHNRFTMIFDGACRCCRDWWSTGKLEPSGR